MEKQTPVQKMMQFILHNFGTELDNNVELDAKLDDFFDEMMALEKKTLEHFYIYGFLSFDAKNLTSQQNFCLESEFEKVYHAGLPSNYVSKIKNTNLAQIKTLLRIQRQLCLDAYMAYYAGSKEDFAPQCVVDDIYNAKEPEFEILETEFKVPTTEETCHQCGGKKLYYSITGRLCCMDCLFKNSGNIK